VVERRRLDAVFLGNPDLGERSVGTVDARLERGVDDLVLVDDAAVVRQERRVARALALGVAGAPRGRAAVVAIDDRDLVGERLGAAIARHRAARLTTVEGLHAQRLAAAVVVARLRAGIVRVALGRRRLVVRPVAGAGARQVAALRSRRGAGRGVGLL